MVRDRVRGRVRVRLPIGLTAAAQRLGHRGDAVVRLARYRGDIGEG